MNGIDGAAAAESGAEAWQIDARNLLECRTVTTSKAWTGQSVSARIVTLAPRD
ncbi:MAG TPA: hypothetical protein VKZ18_02805 [Polyangia bacterium]|nr:hypothetical protein [Polyangia bacterium]